VERLLPDSWGGRKLTDLEISGKVRLATVSRGGVAILPTPDLVGQEGDLLHLIVAADAFDVLEELLAPPAERR
jgi:trk system potassium uptake protein TrkA